MFLAGSKKGGYCFFSTNFTRYQGLHVAYATPQGWELAKIIHDVAKNYAVEVTSPNQCTFVKGDTKGLVSYYDDTLLLQGELQWQLQLDPRSIYDFVEFDRFFVVERVDDLTIIRYTDKSELCDIFIVIKGDMQEVATWEPVYFEYEKQRNTPPADQYVYTACTIKGRAVVSVGFNREEVIQRLRYVDENAVYMQKTQNQYVQSHTHELAPQIKKAYAHSCVHLDQLLVNVNNYHGIYAGLPWFYQIWTRDEAISLSGLLSLQRYEECKKILLERIAHVLEDGRIANRTPASELGSADGIGWVCKRLYDLLACTTFTDQELHHVRRYVLESIIRLEEHYEDELLIKNTALETWMDTGEPYDVRAGFRIEIQALYLIQIRLIHLLTEKIGDEKFLLFDQKEKLVAKRLRSALLDSILLDGLELDKSKDTTVRPNVFLAYYIYPELLSKKQWEKTFDACIHSLFLPWGAMSSIDVESELFCPHHTGQDNRSYHRGDTWYYVNNIAAVSLQRLNKKKYAEVVQKIMDASTKEIMQSGAIGCAAEISDAQYLTSKGCFLQAWSVATYIELVHEVFDL